MDRHGVDGAFRPQVGVGRGRFVLSDSLRLLAVVWTGPFRAQVGGVPSMPAYTVDGLVYARGGKMVRPIFLSARDAREAVERAKADIKEGSAEAKMSLEIQAPHPRPPTRTPARAQRRTLT